MACSCGWSSKDDDEDALRARAEAHPAEAAKEGLMGLKAEYFIYLDDLRKSGVTNMFGAAPYLSHHFGLERDEARKILQGWMKTFDGVASVEKRLIKATKLGET